MGNCYRLHPISHAENAQTEIFIRERRASSRSAAAHSHNSAAVGFASEGTLDPKTRLSLASLRHLALMCFGLLPQFLLLVSREVFQALTTRPRRAFHKAPTTTEFRARRTQCVFSIDAIPTRHIHEREQNIAELKLAIFGRLGFLEFLDFFCDLRPHARLIGPFKAHGDRLARNLLSLHQRRKARGHAIEKAIGLFSVGVLNVNNTRDMKTDAVNRVTVAIRLGLRGARIYQTVLIAMGWVLMVTFCLLYKPDPGHFLFLAVAPLHMVHLRGVWTRTEKALDPMLPLLVMSTFILSILAGAGFLIF